MAEIEINQEKCLCQDEDCHKCQESCPQKLLWTYPKVKRTPGRSARNWVIVPILPLLCTGCRACEQACPQGAIKVTAGAESAAAAGGRGMRRGARRMTAGACVWLAQKAYVP